MGSKGAALKQHIDATLGSGNLREAVLLPPGEDLNEWLAVNTVDFYNAISMLYATLGRGALVTLTSLYDTRDLSSKSEKKEWKKNKIWHSSRACHAWVRVLWSGARHTMIVFVFLAR